MKFMLHRYIVFLFLACTVSPVFAQPDFVPDISRALFHSKLDQAQSALTALDGKKDNELKVFEDEELNLQLTYHAYAHINILQRAIEFDSTLSQNQKLTYIRGLTDLLVQMRSGLYKKEFKWMMLPDAVAAFELAMALNRKGESILPALQLLPYAASSLLVGNFAFSDSKESSAIRSFLFLRYLRENPTKILKSLVSENNFPFTDSLIAVAARRNPEELITYAQAEQTQLGKKIKRNPDPLVQTIVGLSEDRAGQLYFPFLDELAAGTTTKAFIASHLKDSSKYYALLVKTRIDHARRLANADTALGNKALLEMLEVKSRETYVTTINGLHDLPAAQRFKKIQGLSAPELYYLMVLNEREIYTSSYMYVYQRMFEVMPVKSADTILHTVFFDKYKKFITMASNYNTLDNFLGKMSPESANTLMTNFVNNLDRGKSNNDIEDAVDVANAYASIKKPELQKLMLSRTRENLDSALATNNKRAIIIYRLEKMIMESADTASTTDLSKELGILPVYEVSNKYLRDSLGRIILQMFFLDDGTGKGSFNTLVNLYSDKTKWKMSSTPEWVQFTSIGTPVPFTIFANRALDALNDLDEAAQAKLTSHLVETNQLPSLVVHRGHSYSLSSTIEKMQPSSKVVVLGSCGAYHNLTEILKIAPDAYIIGSKQTGMGAINVPLFSYLVERLKMGQDIKWPTMKSDIGLRLSTSAAGVKKEDYEDYIFPHQNLGALFIKAFQKAMYADDFATPFAAN
ncbi:MAG: hypothetical protein EAY75_09945 [Bacteroidetes bacterium]|nr:MAG: hypothetical protein EAY75_09945 [Bacteroidota bacterium]